MKQGLLFLLLLTFSSCSLFKKKQSYDTDVIAVVNDEELLASDLQNITKGMHGKDSLDMLKHYAENWARKKLLLVKAEENIDEEDLGISRLVEDYREKLLLYEYERAIINKKLDTVVKQEELNAWYEKTKAKFPLEDNVYQLFFFKLKPDAPDVTNLKKLLSSKEEDAPARLAGYCKEFASSYSIDKGMWYTKTNVLKNFPLTEMDLLSQNVGASSYRQYATDDGTWFIKVGGSAVKNEPAPLDFIAPQIVKAIIEKRRLEMVDKAYERIYQEGLKAKAVQILVK